MNVEHEEVLLVPRWIDTGKATFKYALGDDFIDKLKTIHALGMDRTDRVSVRGVEVAPRDVLAAITPDPISLGDKFRGRAVVGTWVLGTKDGKPRETFAYQMADAEEIWSQARAPGRGLADRLQPDDRHGAAGNRRVVRCRRPGTGGVRRRPLSRTARPPWHPPRDGRDGPRSAPPDLRGQSSGAIRVMIASSRARSSASSNERGRLPLGPGIACRQRMLEGAQLDLMLRELALDGRPPGVDLPAPIGLGVIRRELIGAQTALEIDSGTPESRQPGSDLAIGHVAIVRIRMPATRPGRYRWRILEGHTQEADR